MQSLKNQINANDIVSPLLFVSTNEETVYYLTPTEGFATDPHSLFSHTTDFALGGGLQQLVKAFEYKGYVFVACVHTGLHTFKVQ